MIFIVVSINSVLIFDKFGLSVLSINSKVNRNIYNSFHCIYIFKYIACSVNILGVLSFEFNSIENVLCTSSVLSHNQIKSKCVIINGKQTRRIVRKNSYKLFLIWFQGSQHHVATKNIYANVATLAHFIDGRPTISDVCAHQNDVCDRCDAIRYDAIRWTKPNITFSHVSFLYKKSCHFQIEICKHGIQLIDRMLCVRLRSWQHTYTHTHKISPYEPFQMLRHRKQISNFE